MVLTLSFQEVKILVCGLNLELWEQRASDVLDECEEYEVDKFAENKALIEKLSAELQHGLQCQCFFNGKELGLMDEALGHVSDSLLKFDRVAWFEKLQSKIENAATEQYEVEAHVER